MASSEQRFGLPNEFYEGRDFGFLGDNLNPKIGAELQTVRVRVDESESFLYWDNVKTKNTRFLFCDAIADCRVPRNNPSVLQIVCSRSIGSYEFFGFRSNEKTASKWAKLLFDWIRWHRLRYNSVLYYYNKVFAPYLMQTTRKIFRMDNAFEHLNIPYLKRIGKLVMGRNEIAPNTLDEYLQRVKRPDLKQLFAELALGETLIKPKNFADFINYTQRDPRLNEVSFVTSSNSCFQELYPLKSVDFARRLIDTLEETKKAEGLSFRGFAKYLLDYVTDLDYNRMKLRVEEMKHPITHYYINSSHNTYLNGNQIQAAKALPGNTCQLCETQTEMYHQALIAGCRCIELDCWDGPHGLPVITHGPIALQKINTEVCEAIIESGFKTSDYPIVLSLENHCSPEQQQIMANNFIDIFGEHLQGAPLESHPLRKGVSLPSPEDLKRKILLKGSKSSKKVDSNDFLTSLMGRFKEEMGKLKDFSANKPLPQNQQQYVNMRESQSDREMITKRAVAEEQYRAVQEQFDYACHENIAETKQELADLINYFQTTPKLDLGKQSQTNMNRVFSEDPEYLMHSGSEQKVDKMITNGSAALIQHTMRHILRVYPDIGRVCSSNFIPMYFWSAGCQMLALNFQTDGLPMQMNHTLFEENGRSGYVLKPQCLRDRIHKMSVHDKKICVSNVLEVEIKSAQFLNLMCSKRRDVIRTSVIIDLYDLPNDTVRDQNRTVEVDGDIGGYTTFYPKNKFVFNNIIKPEHAMLHFRVIDENQDEIAQRFLPVHRIQSGYRHIILRNRSNMDEGPAALFVRIYVNTGFPEYSRQLRESFVEPLKKRMEKEDASRQLSDPLTQSNSKKRDKNGSVKSTDSRREAAINEE